MAAIFSPPPFPPLAPQALHRTRSPAASSPLQRHQPARPLAGTPAASSPEAWGSPAQLHGQSPSSVQSGGAASAGSKRSRAASEASLHVSPLQRAKLQAFMPRWLPESEPTESQESGGPSEASGVSVEDAQSALCSLTETLFASLFDLTLQRHVHMCSLSCMCTCAPSRAHARALLLVRVRVCSFSCTCTVLLLMHVHVRSFSCTCTVLLLMHMHVCSFSCRVVECKPEPESWNIDDEYDAWSAAGSADSVTAVADAVDTADSTATDALVPGDGTWASLLTDTDGPTHAAVAPPAHADVALVRAQPFALNRQLLPQRLVIYTLPYNTG